MGVVHAEVVKLKRSLGWAVVVVLPVALVLAGAANTLASGEDLPDGWHTLWLRSVVLYGLFPFAIGIAMLASLSWRGEHRGSNWNALMSGPASSLRIVLAKTTVIAALAVMTHLVMLIAIIGIGKLVFGLPGMLPTKYLGISVLIMLAAVPVAALQSVLSMLMRSFGAPLAVALAGTGMSAVLLMAVGTPAIVSPYALVAQATQLGTGTFADVGAVSTPDVAVIVAATVVLTVGLVAAGSAILDRREIRA